MEAVYGDIMVATAVVLPLAQPYVVVTLMFRFGLDPLSMECLLIALGATLCSIIWTVRRAWQALHKPRPTAAP